MRCLASWVASFVAALCLVFASTLAAQSTPGSGGGGVVPLCLSGCGGGGVAVTYDTSPITEHAHEFGRSIGFYVKNNETGADVFALSCAATGHVTCDSLSTTSANLNAGEQLDYTVYLSTLDSSATAGTIKITATGEHATSSGTLTITIVGSRVIVRSPGSAPSRVVVHTRQPILRAVFKLDTGESTDTSQTKVLWGGVDLTAVIRQNRGLLEWEVDSAHRLVIGDSAQWVVHHCTTGGICTSEQRWIVLPNDSAPVVDFTGRPLESLGAGFAASVAPGIAVSGAEIETGFSTVPYVSMGVARSTGLVYSTRTSYPRVLVPVNVELPWPTGTPDSLRLVLKDSAGVQLDAVTMASPSCVTGSVHRCRVVLQGDWAATAIAVPVREWLRVETSLYVGGTTKLTTDSTEVVLVDRRTGPYGSGWWPAMYSKLVKSGSDRLLIAPNGAATVFRSANDSTYLPPPGSPVSLIRVPAGLGWELHTPGTTAKIVFDSAGRLLTTVDNNGNRDSVAYNGWTDQVDSLIDPLGKVTSFTYTSGKLNGITALAGTTGARTAKVVVNASTYLLTSDTLVTVNGHPRFTAFTYTTYNSTRKTVVLAQHIGVLADTTAVLYDSTFTRRPVGITLPRIADTSGALVTPTESYTAYERQGYHAVRSQDSVYVELKDPRNHWTRSLLNRWGEALASWDSLGVLQQSAYTPAGLVLWTEGKNADSSRIYTAYDSRQRVSKTYIVRSPTDTLRLDSLVYDASSRVLKHVNVLGRADSVGYDANGNVIYARAVNDSVTRWWRRSDGLVDSVQTPATTGKTQVAYDVTWHNPLALRLLTATSRDSIVGGDTIHITQDTLTQDSAFYDAYGRDTLHMSAIQANVTATTTQWQWRKTRTYLNLANQADSTVAYHTDYCDSTCKVPPTWPLNSDSTRTQRVSWYFDQAGRDTARLNDRGTRTGYLYDQWGRVVRRRPWTDSSTVQDSTVYDLVGNAVKFLTRNGQIITHAYDSRNRDTLTVLPGIGTQHRAYAGPQDQLTDAWTTGYVDSIGGVNPERRWQYDSAGRLIAETVYSGPSAMATTYSYDSYERPHTMTDPLGTWTTRYDALGQVDTVLTPFSDTLRYTYDGQGRLVGNGVQGPNPYGLTGGMSYAPDGDIASHSQTTTGDGIYYTAGSWQALGLLGLSGGGSALTPLWSYSEDKGLPDSPHHHIADGVAYDAWGRVSHWTSARDSVSIGSESYLFDRVGNLTTGGPDTMTNDLTTTRLTKLSTSTGTTSRFTFDRDGNIIQRIDSTSGAATTWIYGYDALDQLVSARRNGVVVSRYGYDVTGRRIARRVYSFVHGATVAYTRYIYHGAQVAFETDSGGTVGWRYVWGPGTDQLLVARDAAGHVLDAVTDRLGSIRGWFNTATDSVLNETLYTPYGTAQLIGTAATFPLPSYGWTGREYDAETGFYYLRARYYDPYELRFIQEDPSGYQGGPNVYAYVGGAVLSATDPSGLQRDFGLQAQMQVWEEELAQSETNAEGADGRIDALNDWSDAAAEYLLDLMIKKLNLTVPVKWGNQTEIVTFVNGHPTTNCAICSKLPDNITFYAGFFALGFLSSDGTVVERGVFVDHSGWGDYVSSLLGAGGSFTDLTGRTANAGEIYGMTNDFFGRRVDEVGAATIPEIPVSTIGLVKGRQGASGTFDVAVITGFVMGVSTFSINTVGAYGGVWH